MFAADPPLSQEDIGLERDGLPDGGHRVVHPPVVGPHPERAVHDKRERSGQAKNENRDRLPEVGRARRETGLLVHGRTGLVGQPGRRNVSRPAADERHLVERGRRRGKRGAAGGQPIIRRLVDSDTIARVRARVSGPIGRHELGAGRGQLR